MSRSATKACAPSISCSSAARSANERRKCLQHDVQIKSCIRRQSHGWSIIFSEVSGGRSLSVNPDGSEWTTWLRFPPSFPTYTGILANVAAGAGTPTRPQCELASTPGGKRVAQISKGTTNWRWVWLRSKAHYSGKDELSIRQKRTALWPRKT